MRAAALGYVRAGGSNVRDGRGQRILDGIRPTPGYTVFGVRSIPQLTQLFDIAFSKRAVHAALEALYGSSTAYRFMFRNELLVDRPIGDHRDRLGGAPQVFEANLDPWTPDKHGNTQELVNVAMYLQDHNEDDGALCLRPGSHRRPLEPSSCRGCKESCLHPRSGSAIIFDWRIWHKAGPSCCRPMDNRVLLSLGFGRNVPLSRSIACGFRLRDELMNDNVTYGCNFQVHGDCAARWAARELQAFLKSEDAYARQLKRVSRNSSDDDEQAHSSSRVFWGQVGTRL